MYPAGSPVPSLISVRVMKPRATKNAGRPTHLPSSAENKIKNVDYAAVRFIVELTAVTVNFHRQNSLGIASAPINPFVLTCAPYYSYPYRQMSKAIYRWLSVRQDPIPPAQVCCSRLLRRRSKAKAGAKDPGKQAVATWATNSITLGRGWSHELPPNTTWRDIITTSHSEFNLGTPGVLYFGRFTLPGPPMLSSGSISPGI